MPPQIFKNRVIAAAGPLPGQFTVENLKQWSKLRKGHFTEEFGEEVTHLLCTWEQFHGRVSRIRKGLRRKKLHIVHYDWFEFSAVKEKRQPESEYSMRAVLAQQLAEKRERARLERGRREGERAVNSNLYHIYRDREMFPYQIDITRNDADEGADGQRYILYLWESNAKPHLYWFVAKFLRRKSDGQPSYYRPTSCSGKWREHMNHFMGFFRTKTGIDWQDRVLKQMTMPPRFFQYQPPTGGKPVGRRLRFTYDYCMQVNSEMRGLLSKADGTAPGTTHEETQPVTGGTGKESNKLEEENGTIDTVLEKEEEEEEEEEETEEKEEEARFELYHFEFEEANSTRTAEEEQ